MSVPEVARWIDERVDFTATDLRSCGPFLIAKHDVVGSLELWPRVFLYGWSCDDGIRALVRQRNVAIVQVYYPAFPEHSRDKLEQDLLSETQVIFRDIKQFEKKKFDPNYAPNIRAYLIQAQYYATLSHVLGRPIITPALASSVREWAGRARTGRRKAREYEKVLQYLIEIITGLERLGFDPGPLGVAELAQNSDIQVVQARRIARKLEKT